jgi:hypothetical protein
MAEDCSIDVAARGQIMGNGNVVHTSRLRIERVKGPVRQAFLENFDTPIRFGVHGGIKDFYGVEPEEEVPATLDHIVAAVGA